MGATGIVGDAAATLAFLASIVGPDGQVVFADGVWVADPSPDGLAAFGMTRDELPDGVDGLTGLASAAGLEPVSVELVSTDEWDAYEAAYAGAIEAWAVAARPTIRTATPSSRGAGRSATSYAAWRRASHGVRDRPLPARLRPGGGARVRREITETMICSRRSRAAGVTTPAASSSARASSR